MSNSRFRDNHSNAAIGRIGFPHCLLFTVCILTMPSPARSQSTTGAINARWNGGAADCNATPQPPIEVHAYNSRTFVLRENLCFTPEAPFMYLLIGSTQVLLIDTGDVADSGQVPLAKAVMALLPEIGASRLPLLVVHTHRHLDHRAGDPQFAHRPNVRVVGYDLASVRQFFNIPNWPNGLAHIDLGDRTIDVIPTPGHNETHVSFYDRNTALFFSGDFLLPGRLLIDDATADLASAKRVAAFVRDRPVSYVLGGHIELDSAGGTFSWGSRYHPGERALPMTKADLLALPAAVTRFNGFYTTRGGFLMINSVRVLIAEGVGAVVALAAIIVGLISFVRRRRKARGLATPA